MQTHLFNKCFHFQTTAGPTKADLAMVFICKLFQSRLQVGQDQSYGVSTGLVHVKAIVVLITYAQYLTETLLRNILYVVRNASNNENVRFSRKFWKTLTALDPNIYPSMPKKCIAWA